MKSTLRQKRDEILAVRADLLSHNENDRVRGLRGLLTEAIETKALWFDQAGHVAVVEKREGHLAAMVEIALCLVYDGYWTLWTQAPEEAGVE